MAQSMVRRVRADRAKDEPVDASQLRIQRDGLLEHTAVLIVKVPLSRGAIVAGFVVGFFLVALLILITLVFVTAPIGEATVAFGTLALAIATVWLALETRAERRELRAQHEASMAADRERARELETRTWAVELRKRLSFARVATIRFLNRMIAIQASQMSDAEARTFFQDSWKVWTDDWSSIQADLFAYMDLAGVFTDDERKKAATALTNLQEAATGLIAKYGEQRADELVRSIDELNVLIDKRFDIKTTLSKLAT